MVLKKTMCITGNDNYDTMKSVKSFHAVVRVDETYSRMNDKLVLNDYCGLQGPTELLDNKEGVNNTSYNTKKNKKVYCMKRNSLDIL